MITPLVFPPLDAAAVAHREAFERYVFEHAEPWHRAYLGQLYEFWHYSNTEYFGGSMTPPYILLSVPSCPRSLGDCGPISCFGGRSQIRVRRSLITGTHPLMVPGASEKGRIRYALDVELHEMIHQWQQEVTGVLETSYHGHGRAFCDKCNEIGFKLGLPLVGLKPRRGKHNLPPCNYWPHNVREPGYYLGAVKGVFTFESEVETVVPAPRVTPVSGKAARVSEVRDIARYAFRVLCSEEVEELIRVLEAGLTARGRATSVA
jgi:hypothetical protein